MQRGRKLNFNAIKAMEGMLVLVHDLEYDIYDQLCYVYFSYVPVTNKTREVTSAPKAKGKGKSKKSNANSKNPVGIREIELRNDEFVFTYDWMGRCKNGAFECYAPIKEKENEEKVLKVYYFKQQIGLFNFPFEQVETHRKEIFALVDDFLTSQGIVHHYLRGFRETNKSFFIDYGSYYNLIKVVEEEVDI